MSFTVLWIRDVYRGSGIFRSGSQIWIFLSWIEIRNTTVGAESLCRNSCISYFRHLELRQEPIFSQLTIYVS
jgi:hypothetical protein